MEAGDDYDLCEVIFHVIEDRGLIMTFDATVPSWMLSSMNSRPSSGPLAKSHMPVGKSWKRETVMSAENDPLLFVLRKEPERGRAADRRTNRVHLR